MRGDVRFGPTGELYPAGLEESVRIVRGLILVTPEGEYSIEGGTGFTINRLSQRDLKVSFSRPFSGPPTVLVSLTQAKAGAYYQVGYTREISPEEVTIVSVAETLAAQDNAPHRIHFLAIGAR